jgi:hypothetical protein
MIFDGDHDRDLKQRSDHDLKINKLRIDFDFRITDRFLHENRDPILCSDMKFRETGFSIADRFLQLKWGLIVDPEIADQV